MSLDDLREHGILLPQEEWGEHRVRTTVPQGAIGITGAIALIALVVIYLGAGRLLTWIALGVFMVDLAAALWICDRAVARHRRRTEREREAMDGRGAGTANGDGVG